MLMAHLRPLLPSPTPRRAVVGHYGASLDPASGSTLGRRRRFPLEDVISPAERPPEGDGDHLLTGYDLDALASLGRAELQLIGVEQLPAAPGQVGETRLLEACEDVGGVPVRRG